jgi:hypothetical protein
MLRSFATKSLALAVSVVVLLCVGCVSTPSPSTAHPGIWMTYARNVPHGTQQRIDMFSSSEAAAIVLSGFPAQWVMVSLHDYTTDRLLLQTTTYVQAHAGRAITLKPLRPGRYVARASQEGVLKAESQFSVRD